MSAGASASDLGESRGALEAALLAAHAMRDLPQLVMLYAEAAAQASGDGPAGFFLTQAYILALEAGDPRAHGLWARLEAMGREAAP